MVHSWMSSMKFSPVVVQRALCAALLLPAGAWAQAVADETTEALPSDSAERVVARSPLWQIIEAHHRQREAAAPPFDRRLTSAQRQELRDQVRRTWQQQAVLQPVSGEQSAPR